MKKKRDIDPAVKIAINSGIKEVKVHSWNPQEVADIEEYARDRGCRVEGNCHGDYMDALEGMEPNNKRTLFYVKNDGNLDSQRPSLANAIKQKMPNATVVMDFVDVFTNGQHLEVVREELEKEYGILNEQVNLEDVMNAFKRKVNYEVTFKQYEEFPIKAFWVFVEGKK